MKKLGLIGGVGPESTVPYYMNILSGVQKRVGHPYLLPITIESLSCFEVIRMSAAGDREGLAAYLGAGIRNLAAAGAEVAALACNTGHMVFDELSEMSPIPLVSIVEVTAEEAQRRGMKRVALLGTAATMREDFFKTPFTRRGIEVIVPDEASQAYIADKILNELELGSVREETAKRTAAIADALAKTQGADAVVLGCTELPLLFKGREDLVSVPLLDTMELHIAALIDAVMEE